jgi:CubicO group peptidase (beta-lactamase class C family)
VVKLYGKPPWWKEEGVIAEGSYHADDEIVSLFFGRGGSYDFRREGDESGFYPRGRNPNRYIYGAPSSFDDGWLTGNVEDAGIDRAGIEKAIQTVIDMPMDSVNAPQIHAILIARHGRLVLEEYFHGEHRDKLHDTRSAAKSLTATIIGAAIHDGAPIELSTPVYQVMNGGEFPDGLEPRKRAMSLEHLLTMSSGFFCDDGDPDAPGAEETMQNQEDEPDWLRYTLNVPMTWDPGDTAIYCSANPNLALGMLGRATGEFPMYTFHRLIGSPLKIRRYGWFTDPAGNPYGGGGVHLLARDFLKLGQLMLNGGTWEGRRILTREFVEKASSPLYKIGNRGYGYLWWCIDYPRGDDTLRAFAALGAGGQVVMVFPKLDLVVASFGGSYSSRGWRYMQQVFIPEYILPTVR